MEAQAVELRDYQSQSVDALRSCMRKGMIRPILYAPTGAGKTEMAIHLIQEALNKGSVVWFVADRVTLVHQTAERLYHYGIMPGVRQGMVSEGLQELLQIWSAQTLENRQGMEWPDLWIIDECHTRRKKVLDMIDASGKPAVGLTATPLTDGLIEHWDCIVNIVTTDQLIDRGWLSPLMVYAATPIDMTGAKTTAGEWTGAEVRSRTSAILGDIVNEWVKQTTEHLGGPVPTLVFSASISHGEDLCQEFQRAGYDFRQSTHRDSTEKTQALIKDFNEGKFVGLVSVEKFVKGFDVPQVQCIVGARPYKKSLSSVVQQMGRGMRIAPDKQYCLYLDHARNIERHFGDISDIWENGVSELPDTKAKKDKKAKTKPVKEPITCKCGYMIAPGTSATICPMCGATLISRKEKTTYHAPAVMRIATRRKGNVIKEEWADDDNLARRELGAIAYDAQLRHKNKGDKRGDDAGYPLRYAKAQYKNIFNRWPTWKSLPTILECGPPDIAVFNYIKTFWPKRR